MSLLETSKLSKFLSLCCIFLIIAIIFEVVNASSPKPIRGGIKSSKNTSPQCECSSYPNMEIVDDENLSQILMEVKNEFMKGVVMAKFNQLDATLLLPLNTEKTKWRRGSVNPRNLSYPASCVKLAYLVSSLHYCNDLKRTRFDCIDIHTHPMITYSDNLETGYVVDAVTEQPNIYDLSSENDARFRPWLAKRNFTMQYLSSQNLIGNQIFIAKTYPTNSGQMPIGAEGVQRQFTGANAMAPCCAASLVLHTIYGLPKDQSSYAKKLLFHRRFDDWSAISPSLPPGTLLHNKIGNAYDNINDLAHFILPNGQEVILAVLSNGYQRSTDSTILARFTELLLQRLQVLKGLPPIITLTTDSSESIHYNTQDGWIFFNNQSINAIGKDRIGNSIIVLPPNQPKATTLSWDVTLPEDGLYEITIYSATVQTSDGSSQIDIPCSVTYYPNNTSGGSNYQTRFSTWTKIGDYLLNKGLNKNVVQIQVPANFAYPVSVNAIKFSKYPNY